MSDLTKKCMQLDLNDCRLEKLRFSVSSQSMCTSLDMSASCPCADPTCQDNEERRSDFSVHSSLDIIKRRCRCTYHYIL